MMSLIGYNVFLYTSLVVIALSLVSILCASEFLKKYTKSKPNLEVEAARYHSKLVGFPVVILGVVSYFVGNAFLAAPSLAWVPIVLFVLSILLIMSWWYMYWDVVQMYVKGSIFEKHLDKLKGQKQ
jgi:hypothetical protein